MGAAVILLVCLVGPNVYAYTALFDEVYVPISPRRPIILVWPSVMHPSVTEDIQKHIQRREQKEAYTRIRCNNGSISYEKPIIKPINLQEVKSEVLQRYDEVAKAPNFFNDLVPSLITWLSAEALECGFYTIFNRELKHIYLFIKENRIKWVHALQELVYILLQVIAAIHVYTAECKRPNRVWPEPWIKEWPECYEMWHLEYPDTLEYLEKYILNSFDIVIAWLFDYLGQRAREEPTLMAKPFWNHADTSTWSGNGNDILCALKTYKTLPGHIAWGWEYLLDTVENKVQAMADMYIDCNPLSGCDGGTVINITVGDSFLQKKDGSRPRIVRIPYPQYCVFKCKSYLEFLSLDKPENTIYFYQHYVLTHAYLTTAVGYDFYCDMNRTNIFDDLEIHTFCYPIMLKKYMAERQYQYCFRRRCDLPCCNREQEFCENVTDLPVDLTNTKNLILKTRRKTFYDLYEYM